MAYLRWLFVLSFVFLAFDTVHAQECAPSFTTRVLHNGKEVTRVSPGENYRFELAAHAGATLARRIWVQSYLSLPGTFIENSFSTEPTVFNPPRIYWDFPQATDLTLSYDFSVPKTSGLCNANSSGSDGCSYYINTWSNAHFLCANSYPESPYQIPIAPYISSYAPTSDFTIKSGKTYEVEINLRAAKELPVYDVSALGPLQVSVLEGSGELVTCSAKSSPSVIAELGGNSESLKKLYYSCTAKKKGKLQLIFPGAAGKDVEGNEVTTDTLLQSGTITIAPSKFDLTVYNTDMFRDLEGTLPGDLFRYSGDGWNPKGEAIEVFLDNKRIKRFPARASFNGSFKLSRWQKDDCSAVFKAVQGKVNKKISIKGKKYWQVVGASAGLKLNGKGRSLKAGGYICAGEFPTLDKGGEALVRKALVPRDLAGFDGMEIMALHPNKTSPSGVRLSQVRGVFSSRIKIGPKNIVAINQGKTINNPQDWDPIGRPDMREIPTFLDGVTLDGYLRSDETVVIRGDLRLNSALLYINGNLTVTGGVLGVGSIVVTGKLSVGKEISLENDIGTGFVDQIPLALTVFTGQGLTITAGVE